MIIGIDGNEANVKKRVGISEYAYWLLFFFAKFVNEKKAEGIDFVIYLKNEPLSSMPEENAHWKYKVVGPGRFWTQIGLPINLFTSFPRPKVFFSPTHYAPRFAPMPTVVSVMDLSFLYFKELFNKTDLYQLTHWTAYSVKKAKKVFTISNFSKNDIIKTYNIPEANVVTLYPGIKESVSLTPHVYGMNQLKAKYHLSSNYVLFVGTLQPRKNIIRLIEAFAQTKIHAHVPKDLQLVIIGKRGWLYEDILDAPRKYGVNDDVVFLEKIGDDELALFYQHALCFVLPSLYEGFGLPVLEAMKYSCPVITSNVSSLPEAGGEAALYVDPESTADIAEKLTNVVTDEKLRSDLIEKGKKQVTHFSWEKTAMKTLEILRDVAQNK